MKPKKTKKKSKRAGKIALQASAEDSFWEEVGRLPEAQWDRPRKQLISLRLDPDVVEWFQSQGPGYQTQINRILRRVMEEGKKRNPSAAKM